MLFIFEAVINLTFYLDTQKALIVFHHFCFIISVRTVDRIPYKRRQSALRSEGEYNDSHNDTIMILDYVDYLRVFFI